MNGYNLSTATERINKETIHQLTNCDHKTYHMALTKQNALPFSKKVEKNRRFAPLICVYRFISS